MTKSKHTWTALALTVVACAMPADAEENATAVKLEARIYQVLTNVTGAGLTSQTLPGPQGWLQIIHQRLDDVELVMEGDTLAWNGGPHPDHNRIILMSMPSLVTNMNVEAIMAMGPEQVAYMEPAKDGLYELKSSPKGTGLTLSFTPEKIDSSTGIIEGSLGFDFVWVKDRERLDGVDLEVGKPILGQAAGAGVFQSRLDEWSCYQVPVGNEGWIYVFLRFKTHGQDEDTGQRSVDEKDVTTELLRGPETSSKDNGRGPKIEVGGSVRVRGNYYSGGN